MNGRARHGVGWSAGGALCVLAEVVLLGSWVTSGNSLVFVGAQIIVVLLVGLCALVTRYRTIVRDLHLQTVETAAARERTRIAEDMHDTLGHQLSVIALRAGALQVQATGPVQEMAAAVRHDADQAVAQLHQIIDLLRVDHHGPAGEPVSIEDLLRRVEAAGVVVVHTGVQDARHDESTREHLYAIVREGVTNAARHAPGRPITVDIRNRADGFVVVTIRNRLAAAPEGNKEREQTLGLALLTRRVRFIGGTVTAGVSDDDFVLTATLPPNPPPVSGRTLIRKRSPVLVLAGQAALPSIAAVTLLVLFYTWASHGAVAEESTFDSVVVGLDEGALAPRLPGRQAPVRLISTEPHDASWRCDYYSDGNFPLALATFEICYHDRTVVRVTDLRKRPWI